MESLDQAPSLGQRLGVAVVVGVVSALASLGVLYVMDVELEPAVIAGVSGAVGAATATQLRRD